MKRTKWGIFGLSTDNDYILAWNLANEQWVVLLLGGEVVFIHITLLLDGGKYFLQARDITWCRHVA